jgi:hypothetical protein
MNQIGIVLYRVALIGSILTVALMIHQVGVQFKKPVCVNASVSGDVGISSTTALNVDINTLPDLDFAPTAFSLAGTLNVNLENDPKEPLWVSDPFRH